MPDLAVCLVAWSLEPHPRVRKTLRRKSPSEPRWKVEAMTAYFPGFIESWMLTSRVFT